MAKKKSTLKLTVDNIVTCAVYAVIGLLLLILRSGAIEIMMTVVGVLLIVLGIVDVVKGNDLVKGVVEAVLGLGIIILGWLVAEIVLLVLGVVLIVKGALEIFHNYKAGIRGLISPIVTIVIGILLVISKWALLDILCIVAGVIFLIDAVLALFGKSLAK